MYMYRHSFQIEAIHESNEEAQIGFAGTLPIFFKDALTFGSKNYNYHY